MDTSIPSPYTMVYVRILDLLDKRIEMGLMLQQVTDKTETITNQ